jgi:hypothetical protein
MVGIVFDKIKCLIFLSIMINSIRSDSYSESVRRGLHPLTTSPIASHKRSATTENVSRTSNRDLSPNTRSATISARIIFLVLYMQEVCD